MILYSQDEKLYDKPILLEKLKIYGKNRRLNS